MMQSNASPMQFRSLKQLFAVKQPLCLTTFATLLVLFSMSVVMPAVAMAASGDENWETEFALTGFDGRVENMVSDAQGNVYVSGSFDHVDGIKVSGLVKWDGTVWSGFGLDEYDYVADIAVDAAGNLYVAGSLLLGNSYASLSLWDGTSWSDIGSGFAVNGYANFQQLELAADGTLYASVRLYEDNEVTQGIYSFDGTTLSLVGGEHFLMKRESPIMPISRT